jgi:hypothetical protein
MKNKLFRFLAPTFIAIILRLEFVFGINIYNNIWWTFIWDIIAAIWIMGTIVIGVMIMFED